jgi:hypothetical protein
VKGNWSRSGNLFRGEAHGVRISPASSGIVIGRSLRKITRTKGLRVGMTVRMMAR